MESIMESSKTSSVLFMNHQLYWLIHISLRLLKRFGYRVTTQYFVNDSGKQMMSLYLAYDKYNSDKQPTPELLLEGYRRIYREMEGTGSEAEVEEMIKKYEECMSDKR